MEKSDELFYTIIKTLHEKGVLKQLMLAGGWCQRLYRYYFNNPPEISAIRTADVDFIVKNPLYLRRKLIYQKY